MIQFSTWLILVKMASFSLNSEITIGKYRFAGVHDVQIRRNIHGIEQSCVIKLPHSASIIKGKSSNPLELETSSLFVPNMAVSVKLGYDGNLVEEFAGFVKSRTPGMPLEVICEGYARQLRLKVSLTKYYPRVQVKQLLEDMCAGTDITVQCPVDFPLIGIHLTNADGLAIINHIKRLSRGSLTIFFISPKVLWCGLVNTQYLAGSKVFALPTVAVRLGWNVKRDNDLRMKEPKEPVQVIMNGTLVTGDSVRTESKDKTARRKRKFLLNNIDEEAVLQAFADEKEKQLNYTGWEGNVTAFLQPFCAPGWNVELTDKMYPEKDGTYLCESTEVMFGIGGARRRISLGPKLG